MTTISDVRRAFVAKRRFEHSPSNGFVLSTRVGRTGKSTTKPTTSNPSNEGARRCFWRLGRVLAVPADPVPPSYRLPDEFGAVRRPTPLLRPTLNGTSSTMTFRNDSRLGNDQRRSTFSLMHSIPQVLCAVAIPVCRFHFTFYRSHSNLARICTFGLARTTTTTTYG